MRSTLLVGLTLLLLSFPEHSTATRSGNPRQSQSWIGLTKQAFIIGVWQPYLKTVNSCTNFRLDTTPALFEVWPEQDGEFCCEDKLTNQTIASYVHSEIDGRFLQPIPYYDVGIVNAFSPFWRSWLPDSISQKDITNLAYCEVNDLKRFYIKRFWGEAIGRQGLLFSGLPFILLVEVLVLLSSLPQLVRSKLTSSSPSQVVDIMPSKMSSPRSPLSVRSITFLGWETMWDLVHLLFLGVNGSLLIEAVGHSDPCGWEAVLLYNSAVVYTYLTAVSILSAVLQQIALWSREVTNERLRRVEARAPDQKIVEEADWKVKRFKVEKEWQLQRMSMQCAVFFLASLYCRFVTVFQRNEFVAWLLGIIIIAQVWSFTVGFAMLSKALKLGYKCYKQRGVAEKRERQLEEIASRPSEVLNLFSNGELMQSLEIFGYDTKVEVPN